jgi:hypothetical protein
MLEDSEIIENMYNKLKHIQNKFDKLGETLFNENSYRKTFIVMLRKLR